MTYFMLWYRGMKKIILLVPALAAVLASCNTPETKPAVDPLTLSFTGTGTADWAASTDLTLTDTFTSNGVTQTIGTLKADKTVNITITSDQVKAFGTISISNYKNSFSKCDTSKLTTTGDAKYYSFTGADFNSGKSYIVPSSSIKNADGSVNWTEDQFWYLDKTSTITGSITCSIATGASSNKVTNYDLNLRPGWNHIQRTYTWNSTTKTAINDKYNVAGYSNTYNGSWDVRDY